jgi:hypothetical protein
LYNIHISKRIYVSLDVDDFRVVKGSDDLEYTVYCTDVGKEGIAKASTCRCTLERKTFMLSWNSGINGRHTAVKPAMSMHVRKAGTRDTGL